MFSGMENHVNEDFLSSYMIVNCTIICMYEGNNDIIYKKKNTTSKKSSWNNLPLSHVSHEFI